MPRASLSLAERALERGALSVRGFDRVLRVAWTLSDLAGLSLPGPDQVAERFRALEAMGYTDVIIRPLAADQSETLAGLERLGPLRAAVASG